MYYGFDATGIKYALKISIHKYCRRLCKPHIACSVQKATVIYFIILFSYFFLFFRTYLYYTIYSHHLQSRNIKCNTFLNFVRYKLQLAYRDLVRGFGNGFLLAQFFLVFAWLYPPPYFQPIAHTEAAAVSRVSAPGDNGYVVGFVVGSVHREQNIEQTFNAK